MRIIYITTISSTMNAFFKAHIEMLVNEGHCVDLACNDDNWPIDNFYSDLGCQFYHIDFSRSPLAKENIKAFGQLKKVIENGNYDIVHCHTPNASVITRLVCRKFRKKTGLKVFYTAHGFHFYKGAPLLNWMVYYPVEKFCSRFTDKLITINKEDDELATNRFKAKEVCYVPGVGIDLSKFENVQVDRAAKRREIGVLEDAFLLISVGELSERKNQILILQALDKMANKENIHYVVVGEGPLRSAYEDYIKEHQLQDCVHLLGYRTDVAELYSIADLCCFPSFHEGLPVAVMEAMACGLPIVCSRIRGNTDLISNEGGILFDPHDVNDCCQSIKAILDRDIQLMGKKNRDQVKQYSIENVIPTMIYIYES